MRGRLDRPPGVLSDAAGQARLPTEKQYDGGQATVEYTLIILVFGIPMIWLCRALLSILVEHYRMVTFLETLPWP